MFLCLVLDAPGRGCGIVLYNQPLRERLVENGVDGGLGDVRHPSRLESFDDVLCSRSPLAAVQNGALNLRRLTAECGREALDASGLGLVFLVLVGAVVTARALLVLGVCCVKVATARGAHPRLNLLLVLLVVGDVVLKPGRLTLGADLVVRVVVAHNDERRGVAAAAPAVRGVLALAVLGNVRLLVPHSGGLTVDDKLLGCGHL